MKHKKMISLLGFTLLCVIIHAQSGIVALGGEALGSEGTASYSVGQVAYQAQTGENGSVLAGMQQVYEISEVQGLEEYNLSLEVSAYPNPTEDYLYLTMNETLPEKLKYQLFDIYGKLIKTGTIENKSNPINMINFRSGTYLLTIFEGEQSVGQFKFIKN